MVKFTNTLLIAAVVVSAIAAPVQLDAREPLTLRKAAHYGAKVASGVGIAATLASLVGGQSARDFDELDSREPADLAPIVAGAKTAAHAAGKVLKHTAEAAVVGSTIYSLTQMREFDELDAREPLDVAAVAGLAKKVAHAAGRVLKHTADGAVVGSTIYSVTQMHAREPVNMAPIAKKVAHTAGKVLKHTANGAIVGSTIYSVPQMHAREPVNMAPIAKKVAHTAGKVLKHTANGAIVGSTIYSVTQMHAREPVNMLPIVGGLKKAAHVAGKALKHTANIAIVGSTAYEATHMMKSES